MRSSPSRCRRSRASTIDAAEAPRRRRWRGRAARRQSRSVRCWPAADPEAGEAIFKKCAACHTGEKGGPNKVGPNLWGIVNRPIASHEGFSYSAGMKEFSEAARWSGTTTT